MYASVVAYVVFVLSWFVPHLFYSRCIGKAVRFHSHFLGTFTYVFFSKEGHSPLLIPARIPVPTLRSHSCTMEGNCVLVPWSCKDARPSQGRRGTCSLEKISFSLVPQNQNPDFLCSLFPPTPQNALVTLFPSVLDFCSLVSLK